MAPAAWRPEQRLESRTRRPRQAQPVAWWSCQLGAPGDASAVGDVPLSRTEAASAVTRRRRPPQLLWHPDVRLKGFLMLPGTPSCLLSSIKVRLRESVLTFVPARVPARSIRAPRACWASLCAAFFSNSQVGCAIACSWAVRSLGPRPGGTDGRGWPRPGSAPGRLSRALTIGCR